MAILLSSPPSLRLTKPILSPRASFLHKPHAPPLHLLRASSDSSADPSPNSSPEPESKEDDQFDNRLSQVRLRYRSGTGKKAELRKVRKGKKSEKSVSGSGMYLPPVALKEAVSGGLKVEFGFSQYSERVNGRIAALGLSALLLVEIASGKGVINYHAPAILFTQIYFVAAVSALYIKYEKERVSVWPQGLSSSSSEQQ